MGRHKLNPDTKQTGRGSSGHANPVPSEDAEAVKERLGLKNQICSNCEANNPPDADSCRKCNSTDLREKASDYRDE